MDAGSSFPSRAANRHYTVAPAVPVAVSPVALGDGRYPIHRSACPPILDEHSATRRHRSSGHPTKHAIRAFGRLSTAGSPRQACPVIVRIFSARQRFGCVTPASHEPHMGMARRTVSERQLMNSQRFDDLNRLAGASRSRRHLLPGISGIAGAMLGARFGVGRHDAGAQVVCIDPTCNGTCCGTRDAAASRPPDRH